MNKLTYFKVRDIRALHANLLHTTRIQLAPQVFLEANDVMYFNDTCLINIKFQNWINAQLRAYIKKYENSNIYTDENI